jgi:hypothetical protein
MMPGHEQCCKYLGRIPYAGEWCDLYQHYVYGWDSEVKYCIANQRGVLKYQFNQGFLQDNVRAYKRYISDRMFFDSLYDLIKGAT